MDPTDATPYTKSPLLSYSDAKHCGGIKPVDEQCFVLNDNILALFCHIP
jgi:hypothetical protein